MQVEIRRVIQHLGSEERTNLLYGLGIHNIKRTQDNKIVIVLHDGRAFYADSFAFRDCLDDHIRREWPDSSASGTVLSALQQEAEHMGPCTPESNTDSAELVRKTAKEYSVAERSFPLLNLVEMLG